MDHRRAQGFRGSFSWKRNRTATEFMRAELERGDGPTGMLAVPTSIGKGTLTRFDSPTIYRISLVSALNCRLANDRLMHVEVGEHAADASRVSSLCVCVCAHRQSGPSHLFLSLSLHNPSIYHQLQQKRLALITVRLPTLTPIWIFVKLLLQAHLHLCTFNSLLFRRELNVKNSVKVRCRKSGKHKHC